MLLGAIQLRASNTALISLPLLAYAVQRVASKSHLCQPSWTWPKHAVICQA